jgi:hypothetical protein
MSEETRWAPYGDEPPWQWLLRIARQAWRRVKPRPPELTGADIVPEGAEPICPRCVLPHHPLAAVCPYCGEIVTRWAVIMEPPWIFVWGLGLWRLLRRSRLSRLVCLGLIVSGIGYLWDSAGVWYVTVGLWRDRGVHDWIEKGCQIASLPFAIVWFAVGVRMWEAAARAWGSWRLPEDEEAAPTDPL